MSIIFYLLQLLNNGFVQWNMKRFIKQIAIPLILNICIMFTLPYIITDQLLTMLDVSFEVHNTIVRMIHLIIFLIVISALLIKYHIKNFIRLCEHIRDDKFVIKHRLVNYERIKHNKQ